METLERIALYAALALIVLPLRFVVWVKKLPKPYPNKDTLEAVDFFTKTCQLWSI